MTEESQVTQKFASLSPLAKLECMILAAIVDGDHPGVAELRKDLKALTLPPELIEASRRATGGEWEACERGDYSDFDGNSRVILGDDMRIAVVQTHGDDESEANAALIVLAVNHVRAAIRGEGE